MQLADGETPLVDPDDPAFMPGAQKEQPRPVLVLPPDAENIPGLKPETIEETEKRMEEKTVKWALFQVRRTYPLMTPLDSRAHACLVRPALHDFRLAEQAAAMDTWP